jgi:hypothetical protein
MTPKIPESGRLSSSNGAEPPDLNRKNAKNTKNCLFTSRWKRVAMPTDVAASGHVAAVSARPG